MKNTEYNAYLWPNLRNSRALKEFGVEVHEGDVRFWTGSGNIALSFMRHASGHNYRNSSYIVDVAMGQIPRSTERISSFEKARLQDTTVHKRISETFTDFIIASALRTPLVLLLLRSAHCNVILQLSDALS